MIVRSKTKRRLVLLVAAIALLGAGITGWYKLHERNKAARMRALRADGMTAFAGKRFEDAKKSLEPYVRYAPWDDDATLKYASCIKLAAMPGDRSIFEYLQVLERYLAHRPAAVAVRREVLEIYWALRRETEAMRTADELLAADPADKAALRIRAEVLALRKNHAEALATCQRLLEIDPLNMPVQTLALVCLFESGQYEPMLARAEKFLDEHPDDQRAELLLSVACRWMGDRLTPAQRERLWTRAAKMDPDGALLRRQDPDMKRENFSSSSAALFYARRAARQNITETWCLATLREQLQHLGFSLEALAAVEKAEALQDDPRVRYELLASLFEAMRSKDVAQRTEKAALDPARFMDADLLGFRGAALAQLGRRDDARAIAMTLSAAAGKPARAWGLVIAQLYLNEQVDPPKLVQALQAALADLDNPYFRYFLGEAYATLGERELAIELMRLRGRQRRWAQPHLRVCSLLLEETENLAALAEAAFAERLLPSIATRANFLAVRAATLDLKGLLADDALARAVAEIQSLAPGEEQTLPMHLLLLSKKNDRAGAQKALRAALASATPPGQQTLLKIIALSREHQLDLEAPCAEHMEKTFGLTPELAYLRASICTAPARAPKALRCSRMPGRRRPTPRTRSGDSPGRDSSTRPAIPARSRLGPALPTTSPRTSASSARRWQRDASSRTAPSSNARSTASRRPPVPTPPAGSWPTPGCCSTTAPPTPITPRPFSSPPSSPAPPPPISMS